MVPETFQVWQGAQPPIRLLYRDEGQLKLREFDQTTAPPYAILSHTWGAEEVTFEKLRARTVGKAEASKKLDFCLEKAAQDGLQYCWVDTCCIDKSDSAEHNSAICLMYKWYQQATVCYVYLSDVPDKPLEESRWFQRGWTLQELIAPEIVQFYDSDGRFIGDKRSITERIERITHIPTSALINSDLSAFNFDQILEWTRTRMTKYEEDIAYSLLGIFGVTMFLNYGEGQEMALYRLRKETRGGPARSAIVGLGGIGYFASCLIDKMDANNPNRKTYQAIAYCHRIKAQSHSTNIMWLQADSLARYEQSLRDIANLARIPGRNDRSANIYRLFHDWLRNARNGNWIVVLDDVEDAQLLLEVHGTASSPFEYLPTCDHGKVLITTRSKTTALRLVGPGDILLLHPMPQEHALELLELKFGLQTSRTDLIELVVTLEHLPLAISMAAASISQTSTETSVRQYLAKFQRYRHLKYSVLERGNGSGDWEPYQRDAFTLTWQISFEQVRTLRPTAADILSLMSWCDCSAVPVSLLLFLDATKQAHKTAGSEKLEESEDKLTALMKEDASEFMADISYSLTRDMEASWDGNLKPDIAILEDFGFITAITPASIFRMHRLVQLAVKRWLATEGREDHWKARFISCLNAVFPTGQYEDWDLCEVLFPQARVVLGLVLGTGDENLDQASILHRAGRYAREKGLIEESANMCKRGMVMYSGYLGECHPFALSSMANLALTYAAQGLWDNAEKLQLKVIEGRENILPVDHPDILTSKANLSTTYQAQRRWREAEVIQRELVKRRTLLLGEEHPETLTSIEDLSLTFRNQGLHTEAEQLQIQVIEVRSRILSEDHPGVLAIKANLALTYVGQKRWIEAEKLQIEVIRGRTMVLGELHPDTLNSEADLALTYVGQKRWIEAEKLQIEVIRGRTMVLGELHPDTLNSEADLALTYVGQKQWSEAGQLQIKVLEARRQIFGEGHPETVSSMEDLSVTYSKDGRLVEAEELAARLKTC